MCVRVRARVRVCVHVHVVRACYVHARGVYVCDGAALYICEHAGPRAQI